MRPQSLVHQRLSRLAAGALSVVASAAAMAQDPSDHHSPAATVLAVEPTIIDVRSAHPPRAEVPDLLPPTLTVTAPLSSRTIAVDGLVTFRGTASDDVGLTRLTFTLRGTTENTYWIEYLPEPGKSVDWELTPVLYRGDTEVTITAEDAAGNRTSERRLILGQPLFDSDDTGILVGFIDPMIRNAVFNEVPGGDFHGARIYATTLDGTSITSVTYELLHATSGNGTATLREDGDWQIPASHLQPGNTTIRVAARTTDGRVAYSWLELWTPEPAGGTSLKSQHGSSTGSCGNGGGIAALGLGLSLLTLRRRRLG